MVVYIELEPNLSNCIETLVKKEYRQTLNRILKEKVEDEQLFERLEVLRLFLESTDFSYLRSQYEKYLTEGKRIRFKIHSRDEKVSYELIVL